MAIDAKMSLLSKAEKKLSTEITAFEMNRVLSIMADLILESSMCRISELVELNRNQIDFENRQFIVHGKGDKERMAFIDRVTAYVLKEYLNSRTDENEALFVNRYGNRLSTDGVRFMLKTLAKKVDVFHVHPHKFRRTSATNNARRGMPVQHIQFLLGHESIDTTMEYVQTLGEDAKLKYLQYVG